jgi:hypothetical protein
MQLPLGFGWREREFVPKLAVVRRGEFLKFKSEQSPSLNQSVRNRDCSERLNAFKKKNGKKEECGNRRWRSQVRECNQVCCQNGVNKG